MAAPQVTVRMHGLREIQRAMLALPKSMERRVLNDGLAAGAKLVRDEAKTRAPELKVPDPRRRKGTLKRAIRVTRVRPDRYAATVLVRVRGLTRAQISRFKTRQAKRGVKAAGSVNPNDPFYWRFVEFGTSKMPARPFLRPAFESRKDAAVRESIAYFRRRVQHEIAKLGALSIGRNNLIRVTR